MAEPSAAVPDASLVEQARRGDTAAFELLVRRHYRSAYAVALGVGGDGMDAEDVCQDAFLRALERLDDCRHPDRFGPWLLTIVRNRARNFRDYRRVRAGEPLESSGAQSSSDSGRDANRGITERAADQLAMRRARSSVVGQIPQWRRPMLAAAAITALISGAVIWQTAERHAPENSVGIAEALGVPAQVARWVRADSTPTPAQLLTALGETP